MLIQDGHGSHVSVELIELARANDVHLLCLPAHTTHILQPLDVGVFKSFKTYFSKACHKYLAKHPGRVITPDVIACLVAEAWPLSFTPLNILSGFRKCGIHPLNPGEVSDRQLAPFKAVQPLESNSDSLFTPEQESLYKRRYEEGYDLDLQDPAYVAWMKINHPEVVTSPPCSETSSEARSVPVSVSGDTQQSSILSSSSVTSMKINHHELVTGPPCSEALSEAQRVSVSGDTQQSSVLCSSSVASMGAHSSNPVDVLSEVLVLPKPTKSRSKQKRKPALNSKAVCITDEEVLTNLQAKQSEKIKTTEKKRKMPSEKIFRKKEKQNDIDREGARKSRQKLNTSKSLTGSKRQTSTKMERIEERLATLTVSDSDSSAEEDETLCSKCGIVCKDDVNGLWICCDGCDSWFCFKCTTVPSKDCVPDFSFCESCV